MTHQLYSPRHLACMNSRASASCWLTSILIFLQSNIVCPQMKPLTHMCLLRQRGRSGRLPLWPPFLRDALHGMRRHGRPLVFRSVQPHELPFRQVPLHAVVGSVALCMKPLDEGLGVFNIRKADELSPQFDAPLFGVNTASSIEGAVEDVAP